MLETVDEIQELQALLDASFGRASAHLRSIMTPERRLSAVDLVDQLTGIAVLDVATVTATGEPRISALDGHFLHGRWHFTTDGVSPKARQMRARPSVSAAFTPREDYGVFCHGKVRFLSDGMQEFDDLEQHCLRTYGQSPREWGEQIVYLRIEPSWMVGWAMGPEAA